MSDSFRVVFRIPLDIGELNRLGLTPWTFINQPEAVDLYREQFVKQARLFGWTGHIGTIDVTLVNDDMDSGMGLGRLPRPVVEVSAIANLG